MCATPLGYSHGGEGFCARNPTRPSLEIWGWFEESLSPPFSLPWWLQKLVKYIFYRYGILGGQLVCFFTPPKILHDYEELGTLPTCDGHALWARNTLLFFVCVRTNKKLVVQLWWWFLKGSIRKFDILCYMDVWELLHIFEESNLIYSIKPCSLPIISLALYSKDALLSELILTLGPNMCLKLLNRNNNNPN